MSDKDAELTEESRAVAFEAIAKIEANTGLSIRNLFEQDNEPREIRKQMHALILGYVEDRQAKEVATEDWPLAGQTINVREALFGSVDDSISITPNVAVIEYNYNIIKGYRGRDVHDFISRVTNGLALLNEGMSALEAAATIIGSGLAAFATAMIVATAKALMLEKTLRVAVMEGVKAMGKIAVVVGVALVLITELLLYLIFKNKKVFLGIIYNNTAHALVVKNWRSGTGGSDNGDLFLKTGSMTTYMETHLNDYLDSPLVQVTAKIDVKDPKENLIAGGIFCAEKNAGFFGTEGCMVLTNYGENPQPLPRFAVLFACPYLYNNGVNVQIQPAGKPESAKDFYDQLYDRRGLYSIVSAAGYTLAGSCPDLKGGDAAGLFTLDANS
jgi:hypothetical protein